MDNVHNTIWDAGLLQEINHELGGGWDLLGGLEQVGVAEGDREWEHPQGDHGWEVVGSDTRAHTEWLTEGINIHTRSGTLDSLAHLQRVEGAGVLNALVATEDVTGGVHEGLAVLPAVKSAQLVAVLFQKFLVLKHVSDSGGDGNLLPGLESVISTSNGLVELSLSGLRDLAEDILGEGTDHVHVGGALGLNPLTVDVVFVQFCESTLLEFVKHKK
jgi:hypothetical protein